MKQKIIEIIGFGMEPERAELMAEQLLLLFEEYKNQNQDLNQSSRWHTICARATLYPGKTIEEVISILDSLEDKEMHKHFVRELKNTQA
jgi:hypothetical protein